MSNQASAFDTEDGGYNSLFNSSELSPLLEVHRSSSDLVPQLQSLHESPPANSANIEDLPQTVVYRSKHLLNKQTSDLLKKIDFLHMSAAQNGTTAQNQLTNGDRKRKGSPNIKEKEGFEEELDDLQVGEDESDLKKQKRLVKNRKAAQLFRARQKAYIHDLENQVQQLQTQNVELKVKSDLLNSENSLLKEQLLYLRSFITQAVSFSLPCGQNTPMSVPNGNMGGMGGMGGFGFALPNLSGFGQNPNH
jgi:hypothetical protein